jgi:hypothetical protein
LICLQGHRTNCRAAESVRVIRLSIPLEEDSSTSTLNLFFMLLFSRLDSSSEPGFSCTLRACNHCIRYLGRHQLSCPAALSTSRLVSVTSSHVRRTITYANRLHQKSRREPLLCYNINVLLRKLIQLLLTSSVPLLGRLQGFKRSTGAPVRLISQPLRSSSGILDH